MALLTLNSCPMFTYQDKDAPRMPEPQRVFLPVMPEAMCDEIEDSNIDDMELVHPTLRKLHAAGFKGTFLKAYVLLTEITKKIGWDQLLKIRSQVFVMEEEYRHEKTAQQPHSRSASTTALRSPSPNTHAQQVNGEHGEVEERSSVDESNVNGESSSAAAEAVHDLEKPGHTVASEVVKAGSEDPHAHDAANNGDPSQPNYTHFQNKRLCERWLDNLFMVLYEDLRVYTIWRTEMAQYRQQQLLYKKSSEEWEILGELAERLHHTEEAVEAYENCLQIKFSPKAMRGVLKLGEERKQVRDVTAALIRLVTWQYRWYSEVSPPTIQFMRAEVLTEHSSHHPSFTPSVNSSRKKVPSRSAASSRVPHCHNTSSISHISMRHCAQRLGAAAAMVSNLRLSRFTAIPTTALTSLSWGGKLGISLC
jgi:hypothetical protein